MEAQAPRYVCTRMYVRVLIFTVRGSGVTMGRKRLFNFLFPWWIEHSIVCW
jgi:hypothetical protein